MICRSFRKDFFFLFTCYGSAQAFLIIPVAWYKPDFRLGLVSHPQSNQGIIAFFPADHCFISINKDLNPKGYPAAILTLFPFPPNLMP